MSSELFTHTGSVRNIFSVIMAAIICPGDPVTQVSDFSKLTKLASGKSPSSINPNSSIYPFQSKRNSSLSNKNFKNYVYDAKLQTLKNMKLNSRSKEQDIPWKTTVEDEDYETRLMPWSDSEDIPECLSSPTQNRNQRHQHQHQKIPLPKRKTHTKTSTFSVKQTIREKITEFSEKIITQENGRDGENSKTNTTTRNYTSRTQSLLYDEHEHVGLCDFILLILQSLTECGLKPLILLRESFLDLERSLECGDEITVAGFKI